MERNDSNANWDMLSTGRTLNNGSDDDCDRPATAIVDENFVISASPAQPQTAVYITYL